ncbi:MAG: hypothetical protein JOZ13_01440 [Alphaproteobacteria bacterium]|nr:hypothetical protein [Alphaproteobacteria bacterium]
MRNFSTVFAASALAIGIGVSGARAESYYFSPGLYLVAGGAVAWPSNAGTLTGGMAGVGYRFDEFYTAEVNYSYTGGSVAGVNERLQRIQTDFMGYLPFYDSPFALMGDVNLGYADAAATISGFHAGQSAFMAGLGGGAQLQFNSSWGLRALGRYQWASNGFGWTPSAEVSLVVRL